MENMLSEELLDDGVQIIGVDSGKKTNTVKGIVIGASVVAAGWVATCLYKKFKKRKTEKTEPEEVVKELE